jgi:hypothetical protein
MRVIGLREISEQTAGTDWGSGVSLTFFVESRSLRKVSVGTAKQPNDEAGPVDRQAACLKIYAWQSLNVKKRQKGKRAKGQRNAEATPNLCAFDTAAVLDQYSRGNTSKCELLRRNSCR